MATRFVPDLTVTGIEVRKQAEERGYGKARPIYEATRLGHMGSWAHNIS